MIAILWLRDRASVKQRAVRSPARHWARTANVVVAAVILALAATPGRSQTPSPQTASSEPSEPMVDAMVGDHWSYEHRDNITGDLKGTTTSVVTDVSANDISVRHTTIGQGGTSYFTYDKDWNVKTTGTFKHSPHDGTGVRMPLTVGKTWKFQSSDVNNGNATFKRNGNSKVVAEEESTTGAGTFKTAKIETVVVINRPNNPGRKSQLVMTTWYSPSINHWVKRMAKFTIDGQVRENYTVELVEYGRR